MSDVCDIGEHDLSKEEWREYIWNDRETPYRVEKPTKLFVRAGGTTHRVVDSEGIVHCVPAPGQLGCALRWKPVDPADPVQF